MSRDDERRPTRPPDGATTITAPSLADGHTARAQRAAKSFFEDRRAARAALAGLDLEVAWRRFIEELILAALPSQWLQRAAQLEECRPRPGEFVGSATAAEVAAADRRNAEQAAQCRLHAALLAGDDLLAPEYAADLDLIGVTA